MNNSRFIAVIAVVVVMLAGVGVAYMLMQDDDSGGHYSITINTTGDGLVRVGDGTTTYGEVSNGVVDVPKSVKDIIISGIGVTDFFEKFTIGGVANYADETAYPISDNMTVEASFVQEIPADRNILTVTTDGKGAVEVSGGTHGEYTYYGRAGGGTISLPNTVTDVKITGVPNNGYYFDTLTVNGEVSESNPAIYAISQDMTISASFRDMYVTDARGRQVMIPENIDSMFAMKSCSLQLVSYFNAVDKITHLDINESFKGSDNRTHTFILKDLLSGLPAIDPNDAEQVIKADVDIVISSTISISDLDEEQRKYRVPVFAINADIEFDSDTMYSQILALGKLFGEEERAEEIVQGIKTLLSDISDNVGPVGGVSAYACGMNYFGAGGFLKTSGNYLPFEYSKLNNVYGPVSGKQPYNTDIETVISKNPQIIFIDGGGLNSAINYIGENKGALELIDAVSDGQIYKTMVYKSWGTNWINQLINVYYVASIVHEGEFDWGFEEKVNKDIIQLFYPGTEVTYSDLANAQTGGGCGKVSL